MNGVNVEIEDTRRKPETLVKKLLRKFSLRLRQKDDKTDSVRKKIEGQRCTKNILPPGMHIDSLRIVLALKSRARW